MDLAPYARRGTPIARLNGSLELVVHYADVQADVVDVRSLPGWISEHPAGLVVARAEDLETGRIAGRVLLWEDAPRGRDPMVLVEPE
jgi:hypothetical protein